MNSRRMRWLGCVLVAVWASLWLLHSMAAGRGYADSMMLTADDEAFLGEIEECAVLYFIEHTDLQTGLTHDRGPADGTRGTPVPASVAATGFGLTAWCIADARGWLPPGEGVARVRSTLRFVAERAAHEHGWLYHFLDAQTGGREWASEASTIDTALFLSGALAAREYFNDPEVTQLVNSLYARIDWRWAMDGGTSLTHGWRPESGFIGCRWDRYTESMGLYLLGIGAPESALPVESWAAWRREPTVKYGTRSFVSAGPLFVHQYAHAWFDFRNEGDGRFDYWGNSIAATLAQREWFAEQVGASEHAEWRDLWGLTASDSAQGYRAWGGPGPSAPAELDGTVVPCAPGGSLPFAPQECIAALRRMREVGGEQVWKRYGFVDAFNPRTGWASPDVIGIDVGITLLMAENLRTGFVWKTFMRAPEVRRGLWLAGFRKAPREFVPGEPEPLAAR